MCTIIGGAKMAEEYEDLFKKHKKDKNMLNRDLEMLGYFDSHSER